MNSISRFVDKWLEFTSFFYCIFSFLNRGIVWPMLACGLSISLHALGGTAQSLAFTLSPPTFATLSGRL
ncbi:Uncharacterized protein APZ42_018338 [Daphnia magna]|uniref:Uncharacterized protein n=1 Tax=Daphnia magna TaxID=35525 RepID=A0A0P5BX16_9CRUS|nr:Uncharacterized protein APZ42_018338 [Daphnia magna]